MKAMLALVGLVAVCGIIQAVNMRCNLSLADDDPMLWRTGLWVAMACLTAASGLSWWLIRKPK